MTVKTIEKTSFTTNMTFNPDDTGIANGNYFGFPFTPAEATLVLLSVPWDVTVSYNDGTRGAPNAIIEASMQVEIYDRHNPGAWQKGIATHITDEWIESSAEDLRSEARRVIEHIEDGGSVEQDEAMSDLVLRINQAGEKLNTIVESQAAAMLAAGKIVGLVGGDHSTPLGLIRALSKRHESFGILHIDAHADLREAYEGFEYSHASIMFNALKLPQITRLTQVAIRDFSQTELLTAQRDSRISQFDDYMLKERAFSGVTWSEQCREIISTLPTKVYISFDIDALSSDLCPSTGTPVPGGLSFHEAVYLMVMVRESGREIIGFDLTEVSPGTENQWDANVGARILYKLCNVVL